MIVMTLEEFAAKRRGAQAAIEEALRPIVREAADLTEDTDGWRDLLDEVEAQFRTYYVDEAGDTPAPALPSGWREDLSSTLKKTTAPRTETTVDRITTWLATWVLSQATMAVAESDPEDLLLEWVDMGDTHVRETHRDASGQVRPIGEPFKVGGEDMPYPGYPGVDPGLWMNCRCTLRPVLAVEAASARFQTQLMDAMTQPIEAAGGWGAPSEMKDYTPEQRKKAHTLPDGSFPIEDCADLTNAIQAIGRAKDPAKAKAHIRSRKSTLGCPDVSLPESWSTLTAASTPEERQALTVFVALPKQGQPVLEIGEEPKHVTLAFLGETDADGASLAEIAAGVAGSVEPFTALVSGPASLGPDKAKVLLLEAVQFSVLRDRLLDSDTVSEAVAQADTHPHFVPHMTLTYEADAPEADVEEIVFDRLAVWHADEQTEYALGGAAMSEKPIERDPEDECEERDPETGKCLDGPEDLPFATQVGTAEDYERVPEEGEEPLPPEMTMIPWHGVMTVEGKPTGDGRGFRPHAMRRRPLPQPLTYQKVSDDGHKGNVTVARIDNLIRADIGGGKYEIRGTGAVRTTPEADEFVGLVADFGRFGVSVDADDASFEVEEDTEDTKGAVWFTDARHSSACVVAIPAFSDAWVSLGEAPEGFMDGDELVEEIVEDEAEEERKALVASGFADVAPGRTEDGPGWLTHPVDTDRLRDYLVRGPGAAKIAWGTPGDFDRCRANVAEYVKPQHINGYCANRHYDALKTWPGRKAHAAETLELTDTQPAPVLSLVAAGRRRVAPSAFFKDPEFGVGGEDERLVRQKDGSYACPLTITEDHRVFGHIAGWTTCHVAFPGTCTTAPHSARSYADFLLGAVPTDEGIIPVGCLTIGGGHAADGLSMRAAMEHYDNVSTAFADVTVGEDVHGIWFSGWVRPGTTEEMLLAAQASKLSGDWREVGANLELMAAHCVNTPGFPISRIAASVKDGRTVSLVAAGAVERAEPQHLDAGVTASFVEQVADAIEARAQRRAEMAALAEVLAEPNREAMRQIAEAVGVEV
jgi:2'-5' RNA ligase